MENLNLPIEHLSYSSLKLLCANQQQFFKNYILGIWDFKQSVTGAVGKAFHKALETYYKTGDYEQGVSAGLAFIHAIRDDEVDFGKTGSREGMIKDFHAAISFYQQEMPKVGEVLGVELNVTTDKGLDGSLPLPVKAITDLVTRQDDKKVRMWDYKVVAAFTDKEGEEPNYVMQSIFNYLTVGSKLGVYPYSMTFVEVKKSQNRNGESQLDFYEVIFDNHPEYFKFFSRLYSDAILTLSNSDHRYLPNFSDYFSGKEAWKDYTSEVIDFKTLPKVNHRSDLRSAVRDVKFVESQMNTDLTMTDEDKLKAKLREFGIAVEMEKTHKGLNVTLYTMRPARGVRMSQFEAHAADIALALAAKSVRVEAPIPGTSMVGVEVSNNEQGVAEFTNELLTEDSLIVPVGMDVYDETQYLDLTRAPHLLIGGTTGSGKSVFMSVLIESLIRQSPPELVKLMLIDPKRTEFVDYEDDPHLIHPVITENEDANLALKWAVMEMENRYKKLKDMRVKNIADYLKQASDMSYLVIVIDELADLMLSSETRADIENSIVRIAQKARAVGIHLVVATQRPSVDVITGLIKANFPTRISFMVSTGVDSKVIMDTIGAEKLIGSGDLLLMNPRNNSLQRLQGFYLNEDEK